MGEQASSPLFGYLSAVASEKSAKGAEEKVFKLAGRRPELRLETRSYRACLSLPSGAVVGSDGAGTVTVLLHGEIYEAASNQAAWLAERFARHGFEWAKEIHGSFALVAVDTACDRVALITDRLNSRRIFASQVEGGICVSSQLSAQPRDLFELDPGGVAWYLVNRAVYTSRTLLCGVSVLERASIHDVTASGFESKTYWNFGFDASPGKLNRREMAAELRARLTGAVRRQLYDGPDLFLALSAGYDSRGLLGILADDLHVRDVRCFSYDHGPPQEGGDAALSKQLAQRAGYTHEIVETYDGNFVAHLGDNAELCRRHLCWYGAELGAWQRMAPRFASVDRPVVFDGHALGWKNYRLTSAHDVLASLQIYEADVLAWLFAWLPEDSRAKLEEGLAKDLEELQAVASREAHGDWQNAVDYFHLDQRFGSLFLPWREACMSQGARVRSPLLDDDILEFLMRLPASCRANRTFYRQAVTAMFPELFRIPRCSTFSNYYLNLDREFAAQASEVRKQIDSTSSRLDALVPPDVFNRLLSAIAEGKLPSNAGTIRPSGRSGIITRLGRRIRNRLSPPRPEAPRVKPGDALMRLIVLRTALAEPLV